MQTSEEQKKRVQRTTNPITPHRCRTISNMHTPNMKTSLFCEYTCASICSGAIHATGPRLESVTPYAGSTGAVLPLPPPPPPPAPRSTARDKPKSATFRGNRQVRTCVCVQSATDDQQTFWGEARRQYEGIPCQPKHPKGSQCPPDTTHPTSSQNFPPKPYLVLRDTLCSCEAYGMKPMYKKKTMRHTGSHKRETKSKPTKSYKHRRTFALPSPCTRMLRQAMSRCTRPLLWMCTTPAAICFMNDTSFLQRPKGQSRIHTHGERRQPSQKDWRGRWRRREIASSAGKEHKHTVPTILGKACTVLESHN